MKSSILITGGCGFIGSHVADVFSENGYKVIIVDNLLRGKLKNKPNSAKFYNVDIRDVKKLEKIIAKEKPEVISHHASLLVSVQESIKSPMSSFEDFSIMTNIVELAKKYKVKHIVFPSSANVYSDKASLPLHEDSKTGPISPYGITKLAIESYCNYVLSLFGIKMTVFRYFNVFGPRQYIGRQEGIIPLLTSAILKNKRIKINGDGKQSRDFIYVEDVARANFLAVKKGVFGTYNVGSGRAISVNVLARTIEKVVGKKVKMSYTHKYNEISHSIADISKIKYYLDWQPETTFEDGLAATVKYYENKK